MLEIYYIERGLVRNMKSCLHERAHVYHTGYLILSHWLFTSSRSTMANWKTILNPLTIKNVIYHINIVFAIL